MLIAEGYVIVNEIADRLDPSPACRRLVEQAPGDLGQPIRIAVTASQEKHQSLIGKVLDPMLLRASFDRIRQSAVVEDGVG